LIVLLKKTLPFPGHWIPAIPAGMTGIFEGLFFARHPGMDAGTHRPGRAIVGCVVNVIIVYVPSLVTGFQQSLLE